MLLTLEEFNNNELSTCKITSSDVAEYQLEKESGNNADSFRLLLSSGIYFYLTEE